jgi:hypothetical protein
MSKNVIVIGMVLLGAVIAKLFSASTDDRRLVDLTHEELSVIRGGQSCLAPVIINCPATYDCTKTVCTQQDDVGNYLCPNVNGYSNLQPTCIPFVTSGEASGFASASASSIICGSKLPCNTNCQLNVFSQKQECTWNGQSPFDTQTDYDMNGNCPSGETRLPGHEKYASLKAVPSDQSSSRSVRHAANNNPAATMNGIGFNPF